MEFTFPSSSDVKAAVNRVTPHIHKTPVMTSRLLDQKAGCELFLKCENFQKGGSYKIRGATNAILQLSDEEKSKGVVTHSSGNFAQALALSASNLNIPATIVMPENAPAVKRAAVEDYGANVITSGNNIMDRERMADQVVADTGATFIHPSNDPHVILGQATTTYELLQKIRDIDIVIAPIGGGGVGAGACLAAKYHDSECKIIGAEPANADDAYKSLQTGSIQPSAQPNTIADGLRTMLGDQNFPILYQELQEIILISEDEIINAMRLIWERMKIIVEPSSVVTLAAVLQQKEKFQNQKVGLIITGGNVSLDKLPF